MLIRGFDARGADCPCRACWAPGFYEHRAPTLHGARNTGFITRECLTRAYRGCPTPLPAPAHDFGQRRRTCARCGGLRLLAASSTAPAP